MVRFDFGYRNWQEVAGIVATAAVVGAGVVACGGGLIYVLYRLVGYFV